MRVTKKVSVAARHPVDHPLTLQAFTGLLGRERARYRPERRRHARGSVLVIERGNTFVLQQCVSGQFGARSMGLERYEHCD